MKKGQILLVVSIGFIVLGFFFNVWIQQEHLDFRIFKPSEIDISSEIIYEKNEEEGIIRIFGRNDDTDLWKEVKSPVLFLQKGKYNFAISYKTNAQDIRVLIISDTTMDKDGNIGTVYAEKILSQEENRITLPVEFEQDVTNLQIKFLYTGGDLDIYEIALRNFQKYSDPIIFYILFIAVMVALVISWHYLYRNLRWRFLWEDFMFIFFMSCLTFLPYLNDFLICGHDIQFHLARIEGIAAGIRQGSFPVRINPVQTNGYGNASATLYPSFFLYMPALFRVAGMSLLNSYKILVFAINFITGVCSYFSFKSIWKKRAAGIIGCALYMMNAYRLADIFLRAAIGEALALAFLPLVFWGIFELTIGNSKKWAVAVIGFTGVTQSHILSLEIYVFLAGVFWIVCILFTDKKQIRVLRTIEATLLTILLNAFFIIPFLDYFIEFVSIKKDTYYLPGSTIYLSQLFNTYEQAYGSMGKNGSTKGEMPLSIGVISILGFLFFIYNLYIYRYDIKRNRELKYYAKLGIGTLSVAVLLIYGISYLVPWDILMGVSVISDLANTVQFLWRFLGIISFMICCVAVSGCCIWIRNNPFNKTNTLLLWLALGIALGWPAIDMTTEFESWPGKEYVANANYTDDLYFYPDDSKEDLCARGTKVTFSREGLRCLNFYKEGTSIKFDLNVTENIEESYAELPLYFYPGYKAFMEEKELPVMRGEGGVVKIVLPELQEGENSAIFVRFCEPFLWKVSSIVSTVTLIITISLVVVRKGKVKI